MLTGGAGFIGSNIVAALAALAALAARGDQVVPVGHSTTDTVRRIAKSSRR